MRYYLYKLYFKNGATYIGLHREKRPNDGYLTSSKYYYKHQDLFDRREIILECKDNETLEIMESIAILADKADNRLNVNGNKGAWLVDSRFDRGFKGLLNGMKGERLKDHMSPEKWEAWLHKQRNRPDRYRLKGGPNSRPNLIKKRATAKLIREINKQIREAHKAARKRLTQAKHFWSHNPETRVETYLSYIPEGYFKGRLPHHLWTEERKKIYKEKHSINAYARMPRDKFEAMCKRSSERQKGKIWITNGTDNTYLFQGQDMPEGYWYGITRKTKGNPRLKEARKGCRAYTNGIQNTWILKGDPVPEGYYPGWSKRNTLWQK